MGWEQGWGGMGWGGMAERREERMGMETVGKG